MEQILAFLTKYGLFIGIVIGTILLFWAAYAIYNAIVRAKESKRLNPPKTVEKNKPAENTPEFHKEVKTPSLEGDNVIKTGPRKMSLSVDDDDEPVIQPDKEPVDNHLIKPTEDTIEKEQDTPINSTPVANNVISNPETITISENKIPETVTAPVQTPEVNHNHENKPVTAHKERRIIPLPAEDTPIKRSLPAEEKKTAKKTVKTPENAVNVEPRVIKVDTLTPKPKKKLPPKYHVLYRQTDNTWYVKVEGSESIIATLETQREAISFATIKALKSDSVVIVHRKDGKIRKQATMEDVIDSDEDE